MKEISTGFYCIFGDLIKKCDYFVNRRFAEFVFSFLFLLFTHMLNASNMIYCKYILLILIVTIRIFNFFNNSYVC